MEMYTCKWCIHTYEGFRSDTAAASQASSTHSAYTPYISAALRTRLGNSLNTELRFVCSDYENFRKHGTWQIGSSSSSFNSWTTRPPISSAESIMKTLQANPRSQMDLKHSSHQLTLYHRRQPLPRHLHLMTTAWMVLMGTDRVDSI